MKTGYKGRLNSFEYRARNPVVVGKMQHIYGALSERKNSAVVWAEDDDGVVGMTGNIAIADPHLLANK